MRFIISFLALLIALSIPATGKNIDFRSLTTAAEEGAIPSTLYHYTSDANAAGIIENGLTPSASGQVFTTTSGGLTPLQAQIELALPPNRGLPGAMFEIDAAGLQEAGITPTLGPLRVQPTATAPGGGTEVIFNQQIPSQFLKRVW